MVDISVPGTAQPAERQLTGRYWQTVGLLYRTPRSSRGVPAYTRWVNRRAGHLLAAVALKIRATPNQLTAASAVTTFAAIVLLATLNPSHALGILAATLLLAAFALDAADGQLARLTDNCTAAGEWVDHVGDSLKMPGLHAAVLISWFRYFDLPSNALLLIPIIYGIESSGLFFSTMLKDQLLRSVTRPNTATKPADSAKRAIALMPVDYGVLALSFLVFGFGQSFVVVYSALFALNLMAMIGLLLKSYRQLRLIE